MWHQILPTRLEHCVGHKELVRLDAASTYCGENAAATGRDGATRDHHCAVRDGTKCAASLHPNMTEVPNWSRTASLHRSRTAVCFGSVGENMQSERSTDVNCTKNSRPGDDSDKETSEQRLSTLIFLFFLPIRNIWPRSTLPQEFRTIRISDPIQQQKILTRC